MAKVPETRKNEIEEMQVVPRSSHRYLPMATAVDHQSDHTKITFVITPVETVEVVLLGESAGELGERLTERPSAGLVVPNRDIVVPR